MTPEVLLDLFVLSPVGLVECDAHGRIEVANLAARRLLAAFAPAGAVDDLFAALAGVAPDLAARARAHDGPRGVVLEGLDLVVPGAEAGVTLALLKVAPDRFVAMLADATAAVQARAAAARLGQQLRAVDGALRGHALLRLDRDGRIAEWSASAERLHQWTAEEVMDRPFAMLLPDAGRGDAAARAMLARAARTGWCEDEAPRARRDGTTFPASTVVTALPGADGAPWGYAVVTRDQSERQRLDEAARAEAGDTVDALTGVMARRAFYDVAAAEVSRGRRYGQPLTLLLVDPDRVAELRAAHGEDFADEWLRAIASICRQESRTTDIVGRVAGEAIGVLLPSTELSGGLVLGERIRERMQRHVFSGAHQGVRVTVCVGVADLGDAVATVDALLEAAATAVGRAQQAGRNLVVGYDP